MGTSSNGGTAGERTGREARILLIEDDPVLLLLLAHVLSSDGHLVQAVQTGRDALLRLNQWFPDLILSDYELPDMNGSELSRFMRRSRNWRSPPIVLMTGHPDAEQLAEQMGADAFLTKPFRMPALQRLVSEALRPLPEVRVM